MQKDRRRDENSDLSALLFPTFFNSIAPEEIPARVFWVALRELVWD
jgi:hypothetical protein